MKLSDISWRSLLPSFTGGVWGWVFCFFLTSCVLTMDDYTQIPEEERGIGEPYTYQDSLVTCTYQYREGVVPVTERWYPYVAGVQDSTVYIFDHIPEEWLPKAGQYVSAGMSRTFPFGLCHRVLSMEHQNGLYAMHLTDATVDDVFAELDVVADLDYYELPGVEETEDTTTTGRRMPRVTRAGEADEHFMVLPDGSIMDFTFIDQAAESPEGKYLIKRRQTRDGSFDDGDHSMSDTTKTYNENKWDVTFTPDKWPDIKISGFTVKPSLEIKYEKNIIVKAHKESWKSKKESEEWDETYTTTTKKIKLNLFAEYNPLENKKARNAIDKKEWDLLIKAYQKSKKNGRILPAYTLDPKIFYIGFPSIPVAIRIHVGATATVTLGGFGELTITETEKVERVTTKRKDNVATQTTKPIRPYSKEYSGIFGGEAAINIEARIGIGFLIGKIGTGLGMDIGGGFNSKLSLDCMTNPIGEEDERIDTIYNKSGMHFTADGFVDFEIFADFLGKPLASDRVTNDKLRWNLKEEHLYIFPQIDNKNTTGIYTYDYHDADNPVVYHTRKLAFRTGYSMSAFKEDVYPVYAVHKNSLDSKAEIIEPYQYTGKLPKEGNLYPLDIGQVYYYKYQSNPVKDYVIWFVPALKHKDGRVEEYRSMLTKWGSDGKDSNVPFTKHLELYQKSSNEKDDTKHLYDKDWDFYHIDDILEVTYVPWDYLKVGYIINVVDAKNRNVIKNSDVYVMGFNMNTATDNVIKPGVYKVSFDIGFPSDGRGPATNPLFPSLKAYPILTVQPYWEIIDQETLKHKTVMGEEKSIKLQFPYTTDYSYKKANFTQKITQPIRQ